MPRKLLFALALLAFLAFLPAAPAQYGRYPGYPGGRAPRPQYNRGGGEELDGYLTFSAVHLANVPAGNNYTLANSLVVAPTASYWAPSFAGGVSYIAPSYGPAHLMFDFRGSTHPGPTGADTLLFGVGVTGRSRDLRIKPYLQGSIGYLATRAINPGAPAGAFPTGIAGAPVNDSFGVVALIGGADYELFPNLDLRIIDLTVGKGFTAGFDNNRPNPDLFVFSTGIVLHF